MFPENRMIEVLIIGALALIVVGPKDLPILMRKVGQFVGKMRAMAAEFRASFDELARQSELEELRKEVEALRTRTPLDHVNPLQDEHVAATFGEISQGLADQMTPLAIPPAPQAPAEAAPVSAGQGPEAHETPEASSPVRGAS